MAGGRAVKTSPKGIALITEFEGFRSKAYLCPEGVPTIGFGFTKGVQLGDTMTKAQAKARLAAELGEYEEGVLSACTNPPNQNEFDALVCFAFNVGVGGMSKSSVIKAHNRGDHQAAARAFQLWNKAGGVVYAGLTRRRAAESALYLTPMPDDVSDPAEGPALDMPQRVDAESSLTRSPIVAGSGIAAGATAAAEVARSVSEVREALGDWLPWILVAIAVGAAGWAMYSRWQQRKGGWA